MQALLCLSRTALPDDGPNLRQSPGPPELPALHGDGRHSGGHEGGREPDERCQEFQNREWRLEGRGQPSKALFSPFVCQFYEVRGER